MAYADVSLASTSTTNPVFGAATNLYFGSWVSGSGNNDESARNSESATAALGNAASQTAAGAGGSGSGSGVPTASIFSSIPPTYLYIGGGIVALVAIVGLVLLVKRK
jgi:hypothetical protein